jgi:hypothetical protein
MITGQLYNNILINPFLESEANELFMISGYASATFLRRHIVDLQKLNLKFKLNLIIGMPYRRTDHIAFVDLHTEFEESIEVYYYNGKIPIHSKTYSLYNNETPILGFTGSANYSQYGFLENLQGNQMCEDSPVHIRDYYYDLLKNSLYVPDVRIDIREVLEILPDETESIAAGTLRWIEPGVSVKISFLADDGTLPGRSGFNWGQRPGRNKDEAYLPLRRNTRDEGFLPALAFTFTLTTDDGFAFDCVVAQGTRKGIQTPNDNAELGRYLRDRLRLPHGTFVTLEHLRNYGRTDYTLVKIDDETFLFDFSV